MKIRALLTVLALTCGAAFAQGNSGSTSRDAGASRNQSTAAAADSQSKGSGEGLVAKTKRAFHNMGDKIRNAGRKNKDGDNQTAGRSGNDTRSMGAAGSDSSDASRRARMDDAYANSKSKQQK
jgi:hypothetical protein